MTFQHQPSPKTTWTRVITAMTVMEMLICPHWLCQFISRETVSYCETQSHLYHFTVNLKCINNDALLLSLFIRNVSKTSFEYYELHITIVS